MSVDNPCLVTECPDLCLNISETHYRIYLAVYLQPVVIENRTEVIESVMCAAHQSFPHFALLHLSVAKNRINLITCLVQIFAVDRHSCRGGYSLSQGAC